VLLSHRGAHLLDHAPSALPLIVAQPVPAIQQPVGQVRTALWLSWRRRWSWLES
jgi:hypothetical protein